MGHNTPKSYCEYAASLPPDNIHRIYHDTQYGFPIDDDNALFGRLILEINQAGLSWDTILKKQDNFYRAYDAYDISIIANYNETHYQRLLHDAGIVRNKLKIKAAIYNANQVQTLQKHYGSFKQWLDAQENMSHAEWVTLFKRTFKFTGGEITKEFLMSTGYLAGAHHPDCPIHALLKSSL